MHKPERLSTRAARAASRMIEICEKAAIKEALPASVALKNIADALGGLERYDNAGDRGAGSAALRRLASTGGLSAPTAAGEDQPGDETQDPPES